MKKKLFVLLVVTMVLIVVAMPATATPPDNVGGRWCYGYLEEGEHKVVGRNEFFDLDSSDGWIEDIIGKNGFLGFSKSYGRVQVHPSGYTLLKTDVFLDPVTFNGKTGTLEMRVNGWLPAGGDYSEYEGMWVITGGTDELAGLHGQGRWGGVVFNNTDCLDVDSGFIASVPYWGSVHFDP
jgi:hypothetical protein